MARMLEREVHTWFFWGNLSEVNHWEDFDIDGIIILKWILTL